MPCRRRQGRTPSGRAATAWRRLPGRRALITPDIPRTAVHAAGAGVADVISVRVNLADPGDFAGLNRCCPETFGHPYPARTTGGARLPPGVLAGIDALAVTRPGAGHRYGHHG